MNLKGYKEVSEFFNLFLNNAEIDIGFILLERMQKKNVEIVISSLQSKQITENRLIEIGKRWIKNKRSGQKRFNEKLLLEVLDVDCQKIFSQFNRLTCTEIDYSEEINAYFFWGAKNKKKSIKKINKLCNAFSKILIAYHEQETHLEELKSRKNFLEYIIDNSPDQIFIKDRKFRFIFSNRCHYQAQGLKQSEIIGKTNYDLGFPKEQIEGNPSKDIRGFLRDDKDTVAGRKIHNPFDPVTISDGSIRVHDTYKIPLYKNGKVVGVLGYARDITNWHDDLVERKKALNEKTTALKVLLEQREDDKNEAAKNISINVEKLIIPYLDKLKTGMISNRQKTLIEIIETNLYNILTPFARKLSSTHNKLSPTELQVARLIKEGKTTQEIANAFCLSAGTIITHRANIRRKLGLRNSKINLRTFLDNL